MVCCFISNPYSRNIPKILEIGPCLDIKKYIKIYTINGRTIYTKNV